MIIVVTQKSLILYVLHIVGFVIVQQGAAKSSVVSRLAFFDRKEIECISNDRRVYTQKQSTRTQRSSFAELQSGSLLFFLVDAFCLLSVHFDWRRIATSPSVITCSSPYMNYNRFCQLNVRKENGRWWQSAFFFRVAYTLLWLFLYCIYLFGCIGRWKIISGPFVCSS